MGKEQATPCSTPTKVLDGSLVGCLIVGQAISNFDCVINGPMCG